MKHLLLRAILKFCTKKKLFKFGNGGIKQFEKKTDLLEEIEQQIADHVIQLEQRFYGMILKELRILAYEIANANIINTTFNSNPKMAGKEWVKRFLAKHPQILLRKW